MPEADKLRVYRDLIGGGYRWILRSVDGEKMAESESSVPSKKNCLALARTVLEEHPSAKLQDLTSSGGRPREPE
jgi:uncharacterized protein YegP (UPF0339 family)